MAADPVDENHGLQRHQSLQLQQHQQQQIDPQQTQTLSDPIAHIQTHQVATELPSPPEEPPYSPSRREAVSSAARQHNERQTSDSGPSSRAAVAVACVACRNRHLKCDGATQCGRCASEGLACSYVKSRRGWKGPRKNAQGTYVHSGQPFANGTTVTPTSMISISPTLDTSILESSGVNAEAVAITPGEGRYPLDFLNPTASPTGQVVLYPPPAQQLPSDNSEIGLLQAFYTYFFPAHPFLLPRVQMQELLQKQPLPHLWAAIKYVASFYVQTANRQNMENVLKDILDSQSTARDGTYVQALLLYAIGLHIADKEEESAQIMYGAIDLALQLGMNLRHFSLQFGSPGSAIEESWRRTWWELYVCDGMFSGVNMQYQMQLRDTPATIALPSEENEYVLLRISPVLRYLEDYDDADFVDDDYIFSSGAYRIDAVRLLGKVMSAIKSMPMDSNALEMADTHLANWALHLPEPKMKPMDRDGVVDEVLFEAHMIVSACSILLNRPRSDLSHEDVKDVTTCVSGGGDPLPSTYRDLHTAKAMRAAMEICVLIKMPCPLVKHTPFFTCAVTMAAVVYLSYWSFIATESGDSLIKEHIRLNIGVLKQLSGNMPIAKTVLGQVKGVAQELFASKKALTNAYWGSVTREEILQGMIEEAPIDSQVVPANFVQSLPSS